MNTLTTPILFYFFVNNKTYAKVQHMCRIRLNNPNSINQMTIETQNNTQ